MEGVNRMRKILVVSLPFIRHESHKYKDKKSLKVPRQNLLRVYSNKLLFFVVF